MKQSMQRILRKRIIRDLKENMFRYIALAFLIVVGMYLIVSIVGAAETVIVQTEIKAVKNHIEDGEFGVFVPLEAAQVNELQSRGTKIEKLFFTEFKQKDESIIRVFENRKDINLIELDDGKIAGNCNEIVLEKRYCEENGINKGDEIKIADKKFVVTGIGSSPDYDAPFRNLSDSSVESKQFGTAFVTADAYKMLKKSGKSEKAESYQYSYILGKNVTDDELKNKLKKIKYSISDVNDKYFKEYWNQTAGKKDDIEKGVNKLADGSEKLKDGLNKISKNSDDVKDGAKQIFDIFLMQVNESFKSNGIEEELTENNYKKVLSDMEEKSDNAIMRLKFNEIDKELSKLEEYKNGVEKYTDYVNKSSDGSEKLNKGVSDLKEKSDELLNEYFDVDKSNMTYFLKKEDNPRIAAAADDQLISKFAGLLAGIIIMVLFTYVISVFVIHGIEKESTVIGSLYALGVTKNDLIYHYLSLPVLVTFVSGVIGTILGFSDAGVTTQMSDCYGYFSIPEFEIVYPLYLLLYSIFMPVIVAVIVNYMVICRHLSKPVLSMIYKEPKKNKINNINLGNMGFVSRFRIRQMLREIRSSVTVVFGLFISLLIVMMGIDCYALCEHMKTGSEKDIKYEYMYTYKYPDKKVPDGGEEAYAESLKKEVFGKLQDVTVLGIKEDNPYFDVDIKEGRSKVVISSAMAQKFELSNGDELILSNEEEDMDYAFKICGITENITGFYAYMDINSMRELFIQSDEYYNVVFSDKKLCIPSGKLYSTTSRNEIIKASGVFSKMMVSMIYMLCAVSILIFITVMYLMMKVVIDRSSYGISLLKVFGYRNKEMKKLYLNGNFYIVAIGSVICLPLAKVIMDKLYPLLISNVACGMDLSLNWQVYIIIYSTIILLYIVINYFLVRRIKKINPAEFLKNRE